MLQREWRNYHTRKSTQQQIKTEWNDDHEDEQEKEREELDDDDSLLSSFLLSRSLLHLSFTACVAKLPNAQEHARADQDGMECEIDCMADDDGRLGSEVALD